MDAVTGAIGEDAAQKLIAAYGGNSIQIPITASTGKTHSALEAVIGKDAAEKLVWRFGGERIYIQRGARKLIKNRDNRIRADFDGLCKTLSASEIVRRLSLKYRLSNRRIYSILKME